MAKPTSLTLSPDAAAFVSAALRRCATSATRSTCSLPALVTARRIRRSTSPDSPQSASARASSRSGGRGRIRLVLKPKDAPTVRVDVKALAVSLKAVAKAACNRDRGWGVIHAAFPGISPAE